MEDRSKFKFWYKEKKIMLFPFWDNNNKTWILAENGFCNNGLLMSPHNLNKLVIIQSIGLKDKNGKLIYAGDIIQASLTKRVVKFKDGGFGWQPPNGNYFIRIGREIADKVEIVDNLYENPELLEETDTKQHIPK